MLQKRILIIQSHFWKKKLKKTNIHFFISKTESVFSKLDIATLNKNINLKNKKVVVFSAIADQQSFIEEIEKKGAVVYRKINFRDHYNYSQEDLDQIDLSCQGYGVDFLITTEKDWVKLPDSFIKKYNGSFVDMSVEIKNELFLNMLEKLCPKS